uniref:Uncharacterized protein n=1 Tax=Cannabis sativa TaxID=3483 RepID=A0A803Q6M7_CANSA
MLWLKGGFANLEDVCSKIVHLFFEFSVSHGDRGLPMIKLKEDGSLPSRDDIVIVLCTDASWVDVIVGFSAIMTNFDDGSWAQLSVQS